MSYDIGDGYYVDDDGNIGQYANDTQSYETDGYANAADTSTSGGFNLADIGKLLSGTSSLGMAGQLAGLGGVGSLLNKMLGGGGSGGFAGYKGSIPKYTAQRTQYAVPTTGVPSTYKPSDSEIRDYALRPGINDAMVARGMNEFNISPERMAGIMQIPTEQVQSRYQAAMGPNYVARRPGSGGVTYFSPMQYTPVAAPATPATPATPVETVQAAGGGMMRGGIANLGGYSDGGQLLRGPGDGVSDDIPATIGDRQPARLADGEFVVPARIVSELGNGSTEAGARKLYAMMDRIKKTRSKAKNIAANTKADKHLPA
jgi:hypothetical protein